MHKFRHLIGGALSGVALYLSFKHNAWWLTIFAIALLYRGLIDRPLKERLIRVLVCSALFFGLLLAWIDVIGFDAWLLLVLLCTASFLLLATIPVKAGSLSNKFEFALAFVALEFLRSNYPWGGFSWGLIGYSQNDGPLVRYSRLGGSALVALVVVLLACMLAERGRTHHKVETLIVVSIFLGTALFPRIETGAVMRVAVVQGGVVPSNVPEVLRPQTVLAHHIVETLAHAQSLQKVQLVIWPENAAQIFDVPGDPQSLKIAHTVDAIDKPFLVGAVVEHVDATGPSNSGILWLPLVGPSQKYSKNHLVPFGEYIPLRSALAGHIKRLGQISQDFVPGKGGGVIQIGSVKVGDAICFEVADQDHLHNLVTRGAQVLIAQSNNATYIDTEQPSQQFEITRFSAISHQRTFVVATTTGTSGVINVDGRVVNRVDSQHGNVFTSELATSNDKSLVDRYPAIPIVIFLLFVLACLTQRVRQRRAIRSTDKVDL